MNISTLFKACLAAAVVVAQDLFVLLAKARR